MNHKRPHQKAVRVGELDWQYRTFTHSAFFQDPLQKSKSSVKNNERNLFSYIFARGERSCYISCHTLTAGTTNTKSAYNWEILGLICIYHFSFFNSVPFGIWMNETQPAWNIVINRSELQNSDHFFSHLESRDKGFCNLALTFYMSTVFVTKPYFMW